MAIIDKRILTTPPGHLRSQVEPRAHLFHLGLPLPLDIAILLLLCLLLVLRRSPILSPRPRRRAVILVLDYHIAGAGISASDPAVDAPQLQGGAGPELLQAGADLFHALELLAVGAHHALLRRPFVPEYVPVPS